jgi:uncharacterized protein YodC (DUF2158 family)
MSKNEFEIGDVVKLKSGGPRMVVNKVEDNLVYTAFWNDVKGEIGYLNLDYALFKKEANQ